MSPSDRDDDAESEADLNDSDPLDDLEDVVNTKSANHPDVAVDGEDAVFLKALSELSDNFLGHEAKGAPTTDHLATL